MPALQWNHKVFNVTGSGFESLALEIFRFQANNNTVYRDYMSAISIDPGSVEKLEQIPFLPISFFKTHVVKTGEFEPVAVFESSGTTGMIRSRHFIRDLSIYEESFINGFKLFYGDPKDYAIFAVLPSYTDRPGSSLIYMVNKLIQLSGHNYSDFYDDTDKALGWVNLRDHLISKPGSNFEKNFLIGVSFALLDLAELKMSLEGAKQQVWQNTIVMETGGMKGRREEIIRADLHENLKNAFGVNEIHSEYGMTELLSQAYSSGNGKFNCPPWMRIVLRDEEDPLFIRPRSETDPVSGVINVIDLANVHSCSFIATDDVGKLYPDNSFEVLGRIDGSDLRGCSLLLVNGE